MFCEKPSREIRERMATHFNSIWEISCKAKHFGGCHRREWVGARAKRIPDCWSEVVKCVLEAEATVPEHGGRSALRGDKFSTGQTRGIISEIVPVKILVCNLIKFSRFFRLLSGKQYSSKVKQFMMLIWPKRKCKLIEMGHEIDWKLIWFNLLF